MKETVDSANFQMARIFRDLVFAKSVALKNSNSFVFLKRFSMYANTVNRTMHIESIWDMGKYSIDMKTFGT